MFCGLSQLGAHVEEEVKEKIWNNQYVDIWGLLTVDQHTVNKERRVFLERPADREPRVAKTMSNWLLAATNDVAKSIFLSSIDPPFRVKWGARCKQTPWILLVVQ